MFPVRYELRILPTQCMCVFRMVLTINSDCFPNSINRFGFVVDAMCFVCGRNLSFFLFVFDI
jgi:hypothetical protein